MEGRRISSGTQEIVALFANRPLKAIEDKKLMAKAFDAVKKIVK